MCVPSDQLDTESSVKLNTSRSWCLYFPLCHQKCWSFCANHLVHIIWQNSRLLVYVYNGYGGGPQNGWIVGAVQSTVICLKSGMLVKTGHKLSFSITSAITFRHISVVWVDDTLVLCLDDLKPKYWRKSNTENCIPTKRECKHHFMTNFKISKLCVLWIYNHIPDLKNFDALQLMFKNIFFSFRNSFLFLFDIIALVCRYTCIFNCRKSMVL